MTYKVLNDEVCDAGCCVATVDTELRDPRLRWFDSVEVWAGSGREGRMPDRDPGVTTTRPMYQVLHADDGGAGMWHQPDDDAWIRATCREEPIYL